MLKKIIDYSNKYFGLFDLIEGITDLRANPQISAADVASSVMSILFSNLGSLNNLISQEIFHMPAI
jgi:hypothetical protein